jgi:hypothetical protein
LLKHALDEAEKRYKNELGTKDTQTPITGWRVYTKNITIY